MTRTHVRSRRKRASYRVGQFWRGLTASIASDERTLVCEILPGKGVALFDRMPVDAQRHSLSVLYSARAIGVEDADLDAAALLHDVGKSASAAGALRLGLWLRGPLVLLEAWSPRTLARFASANQRTGFRYTAYVHLEHPRIGAEWAADAGCSELTCWLIRHHQDDMGRLEDSGAGQYALRLLSALQSADASN